MKEEDVAMGNSTVGSEPANVGSEPESIITVCELGPCPTIPGVAAPLLDEEPDLEELIRRGGKKVG
jgi:hypothetical protein